MIFSERDLRVLNSLKILVRIALKVSIASMIISTGILFFLGEKAWYIHTGVITSTIIWYSIIGGMWATIISFFVLLLIAVVYRIEKRLTWALFKTDVLLLLAIIACFGLFYLTTWSVFAGW
jgi:hypothetical protein